LKDLQGMIDLLESVPEWVIVAHEKPDGDTLGCGSALFLQCESLGKKCSWFGPDPFPKAYRFLPFHEKYVAAGSLENSLRSEDLAVIVTDTSNPERTLGGLPSPEDRAVVLNIDHHGDNTRYGTFNWVDDRASSVGLMIYELFLAARWDLTRRSAGSLFTAIATDTGFFRFPSTDERTLRIASYLVAKGAEPHRVYQEVYENRSLEGIHLWGRGLSRASLHLDGRVCVTYLSREDLSSLGASRDDTENLVNALLSVKRVTVAALFQEDEGACRVSIRTKEPVNARKIAALWGGGGHERASGCKMEGNPERSLEAFVTRLGDLDEIGLSGH